MLVVGRVGIINNPVEPPISIELLENCRAITSAWVSDHVNNELP